MKHVIHFTLFIVTLCIGTALFLSCGDRSATTPSYKVAVAGFEHETCTFCPGEDPGIEDWTYQGPPLRGEEVMTKGSAYIRGFADQAQQLEGMNLVGLSTPRGVFGGISRTWNKQEAFDHFVNLMLEDLKAELPVDGVFLALHGAMAVRGVDRPEAEIAKRFREVVGPDVPIVATFDLHGNEDGAFFEWADGMFAVKRYPHYDKYRQGERAARYLQRVMSGDYKPTKSVRRPPILTATVQQWTGQSPIMDIMERARRWEDRKEGAVVNVFFGFPWSDVPDAGTGVHVMTNDDQALADEIADDMADFMWRVRADWSQGEFMQPGDAVKQTKAAIARGDAPVVLADYWDRWGDATWTLDELIKQQVDKVLYAAITDVHTLDKIWADDVKVGETLELQVGGYTGEQAGSPVAIQGELVWRGSLWGYDKVAAVAYGTGSVLILTPGYMQILTPESLRFGPVDPDDFDVFVLKSRVHFRRGFDETGYAKEIFIVDAPGDWFGTTRLEALPYEHIDVNDFYPFREVTFP